LGNLTPPRKSAPPVWESANPIHGTDFLTLINKLNRCLMENKPKEIRKLSALILLITLSLLAVLLLLVFITF
jgi:hypothetical protein